MPTARYKFTRARNAGGISSQNRASTDAVGALYAWKHRAEGRSYVEELDEEDTLVAVLTWREADTAAGDELSEFCDKTGVQREFQPRN